MRIMIVAGEASGDLHGANLVRALRSLEPDLAVSGMGGSGMRDQGVEILYDAARMAVVGLSEVLSHLKDIRAARDRLTEELRLRPPDLLILIDYPDFNLLLAGRARRLGIPVFYYISPQVWAWRSGRVRKIRRLVDRMAVILPFEEEFYRDRGMQVDFVGHPLLDSVRVETERRALLERHGIGPEATVVGILPGSRRKEIASLLPGFLDAAGRLAPRLSHPVFLLPLAPTLRREDLEQNGLAGCPLPVKVVAESRYDLMAACDAAMVASGTATLELAILGVPMVVCYRTSPLTYLLGRMLIKVEYAALVNLVAGRRVVPELIQHEATGEKIAAALGSILCEKEAGEAMRRELAKVREKLGGPGASLRAATAALTLVGKKSGSN